jgi:poly-gamma-glutamate synthesis protein (capsule biosynthesis protein)
MKFLKATLISMFTTLLLGGTAIATAIHFDLIEIQKEIAPVFADIGAIDFIFAGKPPPKTNYIIERQGDVAGFSDSSISKEIFFHEEEPSCPYTVTVLLSAAGDVTLGGDHRWRGYHEFMREFRESGEDYAIFFENVAHIFYESDISIVNLEGALTDIEIPPEDKTFLFRAPPHFAQILSAGNIDAVSLANNHSRDFGTRGYNDTKEALRNAGVEYFGNDDVLIREVNGIRVGLFGHSIWADTADNRRRITASIERLREDDAQLIVAFFHWGVENENSPEQYQINAGRFTIDAGAHLVLGSHPHTIQGIEEYKGRFIVYSLADFCFGGNASPADQHAFIFQQTFTFFHGELQPQNETNVIPVFMSSVRNRNDFRPTPAENADAERILARLERYSER